jgi:hypothetical protein
MEESVVSRYNQWLDRLVMEEFAQISGRKKKSKKNEKKEKKNIYIYIYEKKKKKKKKNI